MDVRTYSWQDYVVFCSVLLVSAAIGVYHGCSGGKNKTVAEFLLANRNQRCLPVGLSILVTFQSAILFIGVPAEIYTQGMSYLLFHIGMALSVLLAAFFFVPLLFPLKLTSVYKYLELRFESRAVQMTGCLMGMLSMSLYMGVSVFAPATAIQAVSGFPAWSCMLVMAALTTVYTTLGGLRGVIWTDVFQFVIMCSGLLAILVKGSVLQGGFGRIWQQAQEGGRIDFGGWNPDPSIRHSVWSLVIGGTFTWLANIGVNQANVQRFSAVPTLREAKLSVLLSFPGFVILGVLASMVGLIVFSYYTDIGCDPLVGNRITNPNQLVPLFVLDVFSFLPGFAGLFGASLVCASLSTVSSSINSLSAMLWEDLLKWKFPNISEEKETIVVKSFVLLFGVVALGVAFLSLSLGGPATQIALSFFGAAGGPLLGLFLLGALFPWANWKGALSGSLCALFLCLWIAIGKYSLQNGTSLPPAPSHNCYHSNGYNISHETEYITSGTTQSFVSDGEIVESSSSPLAALYSVSYLWYSSIGIVITLLVGMLVSLCTGMTDPNTVDRSLLIPLSPHLYCCVPEKLRHKLIATLPGASYSTQQIVEQDEMDDEQTVAPKRNIVSIETAI